MPRSRYICVEIFENNWLMWGQYNTFDLQLSCGNKSTMMQYKSIPQTIQGFSTNFFYCGGSAVQRLRFCSKKKKKIFITSEGINREDLDYILHSSSGLEKILISGNKETRHITLIFFHLLIKFSCQWDFQ